MGCFTLQTRIIPERTEPSLRFDRQDSPIITTRQRVF